MLLIDRYVLRVVLGSILLVLLLLVALSALIAFVGQLDNVGKGTFGVDDAVSYVLLIHPQLAFEMMPIAALLGALLGLGRLASHSELVVLRSAGIAPARLAGSVALAGGIVLIFTAALGEFIAPPLERYAERQRAAKKYADLNFSAEQSVWLKHENLIINARPRSERNWAGGVYKFSFDDQHRLQAVSRAESAFLGGDQRWTLVNVVETLMTPEGFTTDATTIHKLPGSISPELIRLSDIFPDNMTGKDLRSYIAYLEENQLDSGAYEIAFWGRIATVYSILAMALLAVPFVFGFQRETGTGVRVAIGVMIGLVYFLANRALTNSGEVFELNPLLIAWAPAVVISLVAGIGIARIR